MRFLTLRKSADLTIRTCSKSTAFFRGGGFHIVRDDDGREWIEILFNGIYLLPKDQKNTHRLHYIHECCNGGDFDLWFKTQDNIPQMDGDYWKCPACNLVGLHLETLNSQVP